MNILLFILVVQTTIIIQTKVNTIISVSFRDIKTFNNHTQVLFDEILNILMIRSTELSFVVLLNRLSVYLIVYATIDLLFLV